jgi:hypothetical protein
MTYADVGADLLRASNPLIVNDIQCGFAIMNADQRFACDRTGLARLGYLKPASC